MFMPESPFPFVLTNGASVTDERCTCGRLRSTHSNTLAYGHGSVVEPETGVILCARFTWSTWVFTTMNMLHGFESLDDLHVIKLERANKRNVGAKGWRYEIRDMSKQKGGARLISCAAPSARTRTEAKAHAREELRVYLQRRASLHVLDGGAQ
jgi:hypothetical protein